jgi:prepilin-type N-terminal cleavage/methylation domain-containing protein
MAAQQLVRDERGFTLIEVMVAILILAVGIAGALAMIDGANARTLDTKQREAATALSREVIEAARSVPYDQLNPGSMVTQIQAIPGLADSSGDFGWTVERRNQTYTIAMSVCSVDDDQDTFGNTGSGNFCAGTGGVAGTDRNPDDYKRVSVQITWQRGSVQRSIQQHGIVNNEASAVGPSVDFTDQIPGGLGETQILVDTPTVTFKVDAEDDAVSIRFAVDGVVKDTVNADNALFTWEINTADEQVADGTYVVSVTAFDEEGTPGPTRSRTLRLNRLIPAAPQDVFGGWNSRAGYALQNIVEIQWARNLEPDVTGYRVYREVGTSDHIVCDFTLQPTKTECQDLSPPSTGVPLEYYVVAYDKDPFTGDPRAGDDSDPHLFPNKATTRPNQAPSLNASVDGDTVVLDWDDAPAASPNYTGSAVIFYRIYRGGTALGNRIARTTQDNPTSFRDFGAAGKGHTYWISTVDENFSESAPLGPVSEP